MNQTSKDPAADQAPAVGDGPVSVNETTGTAAGAEKAQQRAEAGGVSPPISGPTIDPNAPKTLQARPRTIVIMAVIALIGVLLILRAWRLWPFATPVMTTENSYVRGQVTVLAPQVNGYVVDVLVHDFDKVTRGQLLLRIDDRIYSQQLDQALAQLDARKAELANAEQSLASNQATIESRKAELGSARAEFDRAKADQGRADELIERGSVSERERDQITATARAAQARVASAQAAIHIAQESFKATGVSRGGLEAAVRAAEAQVKLARINLDNTRIVAPDDGQLSEVSVRLGQYVAAGSQLLYVVPRTLWVIANYKETQTANMAIGQRATFSVDALDGAHFTGRVERFSPATGSEFSVLRPDNATGNFTKVVQRIPVRIAIDADQKLVERLRPGMSVITRVDTASAADDAHAEPTR